jgi:methionyl-tRNA formyltransferase
VYKRQLRYYGTLTTGTDLNITPEYIEDFDWVVSYGYTKIIRKEVITRSRNPIINLHISLLPYNRGASPNFWSWYDNTSKGVSIHAIDEGIDTGDIFVQRKLSLSEKETLRSSYLILRKEIEELFKKNFEKIISGDIISFPQEGEGTFHMKKDLEMIWPWLKDGWETPVKEIMKLGNKHGGSFNSDIS